MLILQQKARVPQESQDHQEGRPPVGMRQVQDQASAGAEAMQALRAWVRPRTADLGRYGR